MLSYRNVTLVVFGGLASLANAHAADLPFRKAAPADYVRVCDFTGKGYFYIPGSDTCLRIGGYVRTQYDYLSPSTAYFPAIGSASFGSVVAAGTRIPVRLRDVTGFFVRGRIEADARTQTAYGTLRTFVRFDVTKANGTFQGSSTSQQSYVNGNSTAPNVDKAFITFAGLSAGRMTSFFDFYADNYNFEGIATSDQSTQLFAYTATFGNGFTATIAAEDPSVRRDGIGNSAILNTAGSVRKSSHGYGAETYPDAVAQLHLTQSWGAAQLAAAYHEVATISTASFAARSAAGFAVRGGVQIKLPTLAAGDDLYLEGGYQQGGFKYQDSAGTMNSGTSNALFLGGFQHLDRDAYAFPNPDETISLSLSRGFSVLGAFHHYFTPNYSDVLFGSYEEVSYGTRARTTDWRLGGIGDASEYRIGNQFVWTPTNNLVFAIEGIYAHLDQTIAGGSAAQTAFRGLRIEKNPSTFEGRFRVQRDF